VCLKLDSNIVPVEDMMEILQIIRSGGMMNTLEKFYIYKERMFNRHSVNDKC
jgi:hypothetical protein